MPLALKANPFSGPVLGPDLGYTRRPMLPNNCKYPQQHATPEPSQNLGEPYLRAAPDHPGSFQLLGKND